MFYWKEPIEWEKDTLGKMVRLYCRAKHQNINLCQDCQELLVYSKKRLDSCKYGKLKPACGKCPVHCYKPIMRERVREIMRYAGPRMIIHHPLNAIQHLLKTKQRRRFE